MAAVKKKGKRINARKNRTMFIIIRALLVAVEKSDEYPTYRLAKRLTSGHTIDKSSFSRALKRLIESGYVVPKEGSSGRNVSHKINKEKLGGDYELIRLDGIDSIGEKAANAEFLDIREQ